MRWFDDALFVAAVARGALLDERSSNPRASQLRALRALLRRAEGTQFGREHGFASLHTYEAFRSSVPLRAYAALKPWLTRAFAGEPDVVWPGKVPYFGMSSGTTAGNKYLPISLDLVKQQQRGGFEPIASFVRNGGARDVLGGRAILLGGTTALEQKPNGVLVGDNTGIMARHIPGVLRRKHLPSPPVRALASWDDKLTALAREAVHADVRMIAGTPSWFVGLFDEVLRVAAARTILEVWPRLRLMTGGGVRYEPYRALIEGRLGGRVQYIDVYNATEGGIMGVQDRLDDGAMRLLPDAGVFYEFVPIEQLHGSAPQRVPLWEVEVDKVYALAISSKAGLFGYVIGDCVRFVQTFPHRFLFEGRNTAFLNVSGEHVSQAELERAVSSACTEQSCALVDFSVSPVVPAQGAPRHVYFVEAHAELDSARLAASIDRDIQRGNEDYLVHRSSERGLAPPQVVLMQRGGFERFMRERGKLGGQNKVPRVVEDPALLSLLTSFARS
jgi:hypothetical protein